MRTLEQLQQPDARMPHFAVWDGAAFRTITQEDRYESIAALALDQAVPSDIRIHFDTARNVYLYAWFVYRFHVVAEQQVLATLELALRTRLISAGILDAHGEYRRVRPPTTSGGPPRVKSERVGLRRLQELASEAGLLRNDRIKDRAAWAARLARQRQSIEQMQKMTELALTEMAVPDEAPVPSQDELDFDWIGHFAKHLPDLRNTHAHGSSNVHASVLRTFQFVRALIQQLFVDSAAGDTSL
ncbi:hypothetical protein [Methylibium petroleiphilum]